MSLQCNFSLSLLGLTLTDVIKQSSPPAASAATGLRRHTRQLIFRRLVKRCDDVNQVYVLFKIQLTAANGIQVTEADSREFDFLEHHLE